MKKLLPVILALLGLAIGTGLGVFLKPHPVPDQIASVTQKDEHSTQSGDTNSAHDTAAKPEAETPVRRSDNPQEEQNSAYEYVKLNNQFVVPVVKGTKIAALVVMSLSIEVTIGQKEVVFSREPKLRDTFLQVLFNHANAGGFDGAFTSGEKMGDLRGSLFQAAVKILGPIATDVLVIDIVRQDI